MACCRFVRILIFIPIFISNLSAHAQTRDIDDLVSHIESGSRNLTIDASMITADGYCSQSEAPAKLFHAASISKLFTAVLVFQLRDEGLLLLDDKIGNYLQEFEDSEIQIGHLLTHTSGLIDVSRADGRTTKEQVNRYIESLSQQRTSNPGVNWHYADANFNVLGRVLESITGQRFAEIVAAGILEPAGMVHTQFDITRTDSSLLMSSYSERGQELDHPWDIAFMPSAGMQTTALDLARFANALLSISKELENGFLSSSSLEEMTTYQVETDWHGISQGYGWQLASTSLGRQWRHAGSEDGFESLLTLYPEADLGIAVLGNQEDWPRFELERDIRQAVTTGSVDCAP